MPKNWNGEGVDPFPDNRQEQRYVLGVDGGGSKTVGILADVSGVERARVMLGASNPNVVGIEASAGRLAEVVRTCCAAAGVDPRLIAKAVFGIAGAGSENNRRDLALALSTLLVPSIPFELTTDARIALEGSFSGGPGAAIVAGTGSIVVVKNDAHEIASYGGWGRLIGDPGSGTAIGMDAVRMVVRTIDGVEHAGALRSALAREYHWNSRSDIISAVYRQNFDIAAIVPLVMKLVEAEDPYAIRIFRNAAAELADLAATILSMTAAPSIRVATCGGLIDHATNYRTMLVEELTAKDSRIAAQMPERSPVMGAVLMARGQDKDLPQ